MTCCIQMSHSRHTQGGTLNQLKFTLYWLLYAGLRDPVSGQCSGCNVAGDTSCLVPQLPPALLYDGRAAEVSGG